MFELIEPAGPTASMFLKGTATTLPPRSTYGKEKSGADGMSRTDVLERVMPSGVKMRSLISASQGWPATRSTRIPAVMNIRLLY